MIIKIKKLLIWLIEYLLNPLILWSFGWKRKIRTCRKYGIFIHSYPVWEDPKNKGIYYEVTEAIKRCEKAKQKTRSQIQEKEW